MNNSNSIQALQIFAIISVLLSSAVILTYVLFRSMRSKIFMKIITYLAISNFLSDLSYCSTDRPISGWWCDAQSFLTLTFFPASWMWTTVISYFLFSIATKGSVPGDSRNIHVLCWGLPLVLTFFNLPISPFGRSQYTESFEVCNFKHDYYSVAAYHYVTFYGLLLVCFGSMICWRHTLRLMERKGELGQYKDAFTIAQQSLSYFPIALVFCWVPRLVAIVVTTAKDSSAENTSRRFALASVVLKVFYGTACSFIFFKQSSEARNLWWKLVVGNNAVEKDAEGEEEVRPTEDTFSVLFSPSEAVTIRAATEQKRAETNAGIEMT